MALQKIKKQIKSVDFIAQPRALNQEYDNKYRFILPIILILTALVFANSLTNDFVNNWDDDGYILKNEIIKHLNWENIKIIFSSFYKGNYHPLTTLSYAVEYSFFGLNPFPYHLTNYILHLFNIILVFIFLIRLSGKQWLAAVAALFFAVHPMHVESVAWISERKDLLYTFFFFLSLISYNTYFTKGKKDTHLIWSFVWFFLAVMSKSAAICLPFVLVLIDYYHQEKITWKTFVIKNPFFGLSLLFGVLAVLSQQSAGSVNIGPHYSMMDRLFFFSYASVYYIFQVFVPFSLSALHYYPIKTGNFLPYEYYLSMVALLLIVWGVIKSGRYKRILVFGLLFYFVTIVLVLQILPVGMAIVSERYAYVPYIGIFFIIGHLFSDLKDSTFSVKPGIFYAFSFVLVLYTVLFVSLSYERNKVWKNGITLFTDVIDKYKEQPLEEALVTPKTKFYETAYLYLSTSYINYQMHPESIAVLHKVLIFNPHNYLANNSLGYEYGCIKDWDKGIKYCQRALYDNPGYQPAKNNIKWMKDEKARLLQ